MSVPAAAGLVGDGTNVIEALTYLNVSNPPPGPVSVPPVPNTIGALQPDCTTVQYCSLLDYPPVPQSFPLPTIGASGIVYGADALTDTQVTVTDTQITITNNFSGLFCYYPTGCVAGDFSGYGFFFSSGVDITGVTVDPASSPAFLPISGGLTFTATSIEVNLNGQDPVEGNKLILDLTFPGNGNGGGGTVPEASNLGDDAHRLHGASLRRLSSFP